MSEGKRHARLVGFLRSASISLAMTIVLCVAIEGSFRLIGRIQTGEWPMTRAERQAKLVETIGRAYEKHPYLVVRARPDVDLDVSGHRLHFDSRGYRGAEVAMPKPEGRYRILCVGGSTTFDLLAPDDASAWPARLGRLLAADDVDTVNAGFPGWTTVENLISLELRDVDVKPNLVVVFAGINDLQPDSHRPFARDYSVGHGELLPRVLGLKPIHLPIAAHSVFIEWLRTKIWGPQAASRAYAPVWRPDTPRMTRIPKAAGDVFRRNLRSIIAVANANGARVLLVAQHVILAPGSKFDRDYLESWAPGLTPKGFVDSLARLNAVARGLANDGLASFVDPFEKESFTPRDFGDPMHFNAAGSKKFAQVIADTVRGIRKEAGSDQKN